MSSPAITPTSESDIFTSVLPPTPESSQLPSPNVPRLIPIDSMGPTPPRSPLLFVPSRPTIRKPEQNPSVRFIKTTEELYGLGNANVDRHSTELEVRYKKLEELHKAYLEKMEENAKKTQEAGVWSYLQEIGSAILSAISVFLGISLAAVPATSALGVTLIGVGIFGLAHLAIKESGFWDWVAEKIAKDNEEQKKRIAHLIPFVLGLLIGIAKFASFGAIPMFGALNTASKILDVAHIVANTTTVVVSVGEQISKSQVTKTKAEATKLQNDYKAVRLEIEKISETLKPALDAQKQATKTAQQLLATTEKMYHHLQQQA